MGKNKIRPLHPGGIAIVTTKSMHYMAHEAYRELAPLMKKRSLAFCMMDYTKFSRSEVLPQVLANVRRKHMYLFYDFNGDACHDSFVLQLTISAIQDAGADSITVVLPFMPFLRQDRKDRSRVAISAKDFIQGYERFEKVERTITLDMHAEQTQIRFDRRSDHLPGHVIFEPWIRATFGRQVKNLVIVGPDAGSEKRVERLAKRLGCDRAFLTKKRTGSEVEMREIHGAKVKGKICIINDDILDTCGTMAKAAAALKDAGAKRVYLTGTHAVFGGNAYATLAATGCKVVVTDSLKVQPHDWLTVLPLARYLAYAILQNEIEEGSVSHIIEHGLPNAT